MKCDAAVWGELRLGLVRSGARGADLSANTSDWHALELGKVQGAALIEDAAIKWTASEWGDAVQPPLVSLVVINRNYAQYVGATIDSLKRQDYPSLDAIIVDNGSTDASREVITKHVGDDKRFQVIQLEKNLGQLGAFLDIFESIRGEFVAVVDADDILFPNYVSSHVQVHLALPHSVALTSSNVLEMSAEGRLLTSSYAAFNTVPDPLVRGFRPLNASPRLSIVSDADYEQLAQSVATYVAARGWIWGPGTSNMYRRSVLALIHHKPKDRIYIRAADNHLNHFCHALGGSALINRPLSAYRLHNANYFSHCESLLKLPSSRAEARERSKAEQLETLGVLLERAADFKAILGNGFWGLLDELSEGLRDPAGIFGRPDCLQLFNKNHYEVLREEFGEADVLTNLSWKTSPKDLHAVIRAAHNGRIPLRLRLLLLRNGGSSVRSAIGKAVKKIVGNRAGQKIGALVRKRGLVSPFPESRKSVIKDAPKTIVLDALGETYLRLAAEHGIEPALLHRVAVMSAGTLDSLPHNGAVVTLLAVCRVSHREGYFDIFMGAIVGAILALATVIVLSSALGSF